MKGAREEKTWRGTTQQRRKGPKPKDKSETEKELHISIHKSTNQRNASTSISSNSRVLPPSPRTFNFMLFLWLCLHLTFDLCFFSNHLLVSCSLIFVQMKLTHSLLFFLTSLFFRFISLTISNNLVVELYAFVGILSALDLFWIVSVIFLGENKMKIRMRFYFPVYMLN